MGLVLVGMYLCLYAAIERIPLGIAITFQFVGPLGFSVAKSCRGVDLLWVFLAASGITLISPLGRLAIHPVGVSLALLSGLFLAAYIALATKVGRRFQKGKGLALAITVSAIALLPVGANASRVLVMDPHLFLVGLGVAILSAVVPFSLDAIVLKRTSAKTFSLLLSLEPAIAASIGWLVLDEQLSLRSLTGIMTIVMAAAGHSRFQSDC